MHEVRIREYDTPRIWGTMGCDQSIIAAAQSGVHRQQCDAECRRSEQSDLYLQDRICSTQRSDKLDTDGTGWVRVDIQCLVSRHGSGDCEHFRPDHCELLCSIHLSLDGTEMDVWMSGQCMLTVILADSKDSAMRDVSLREICRRQRCVGAGIRRVRSRTGRYRRYKGRGEELATKGKDNQRPRHHAWVFGLGRDAAPCAGMRAVKELVTA
jgi:hypothetical protein